MTRPEQLRARYRDRKARRVCVDCEAPAGTFSRCLDCREKGRASRSRYDHANPEVVAARMKRLYWQDPEKFRERARKNRLAKKLRGECEKCPEPALDDSQHCALHKEIERARRADYNKRKAAGLPLKKGGRRPGSGTTTPIATPCACGRPLAAGSDSCDRCSHLDGSRSLHGEVIAALRGGDGMSLVELASALDRYSSIDSARRALLKVVQRLSAEGRIRRYWRNEVHDAGRIESHRHGARSMVRGGGCWVYALDGLTEREWKRRAA